MSRIPAICRAWPLYLTLPLIAMAQAPDPRIDGLMKEGALFALHWCSVLPGRKRSARALTKCGLLDRGQFNSDRFGRKALV